MRPKSNQQDKKVGHERDQTRRGEQAKGVGGVRATELSCRKESRGREAREAKEVR